jgi:hypothetical protein
LIIRVRQLFRADLKRTLKHRTIAIEIGIGCIDRCHERPERSRDLVVDAEVLSQLAPQ